MKAVTEGSQDIAAPLCDWLRHAEPSKRREAAMLLVRGVMRGVGPLSWQLRCAPGLAMWMSLTTR